MSFRGILFFLFSFFINVGALKAECFNCGQAYYAGSGASSCGRVGGCGFQTFTRSATQTSVLPGVQTEVRPEFDEAFSSRDYWIPKINGKEPMKRIRLDNQGWAVFVDNEKILRRIGKDEKGEFVVPNSQGKTIALNEASSAAVEELKSLLAVRSPGKVTPSTSGTSEVDIEVANTDKAPTETSGEVDFDVSNTGAEGQHDSKPRLTGRSVGGSQPKAETPVEAEGEPVTQEVADARGWISSCNPKTKKCFAKDEQGRLHPIIKEEPTPTKEVEKPIEKPIEKPQTPSVTEETPKNGFVSEILLKTTNDYRSLREKGGDVVVLTFTQPSSCDPCQKLEPTLSRLKNQKLQGVTFAKDDIDTDQGLLAYFQSNRISIPTVPRTFIMKRDGNGWYKITNDFSGNVTESTLSSAISNASRK